MKIVGVLRVCDYRPTFALAVARNSSDSNLWIQVSAPASDLIERFTLLPEADVSDVQEVDGPSVEIGDKYIHAFIDRAGGLYLDSANELRVVLNVALNDPQTPGVVRLTISELLHDQLRSVELRNALATDLSNSFGYESGQAFLSSSATGKLWEILELNALNEAALERIRRSRGRVSARIQNGTTEIDISAISAADLRISEEDIARHLGIAMGELSFSSDMPRANLSGLPDSTEPTVLTIMEAMRRSPRQEERLAILLRALILHPAPALTAMDRYVDPAQMANQAIASLKKMTADFQDQPEIRRQIIIASLMRTIFRDAYPRRRGALLFYFAEHLSDFPEVADALQQLLRNSRADAVEVLRDRIERALANRNGLRA